MGRKRKGSVIGDIGKMFVNTIASPLEALTGTNFVDFKYTSDFGKGASKVMEPINKAIGGATAALGTAALNAVAPGAGTALSGFGQGLGQGMNQQMNPNTNIQQPPTQMSNKTRSGITSKPYGSNEMNQTKFKHGGMLKTYNAPTHENGGQMIDANANPTNNPNKAVGEIEKKETSWNGYVFSDTLGEGKKTFAQMSKEIVNRYRGKRDNLSKKTMERELSLLVQKNEAARLEKEQMEMQQMQNQFTEEQIAALQDPESGRRAKAEIFGDERYQQQGQPSEEEMMMMQQMQQQGGMPQEGMPQDMGQYRWGGNMDIPMYQYQNGGMLEVPEAPLDEYKKGGWIQKVTKSIKKRGTEGVCTGDKFGGPSCPPGSKRYNLAKTFKAMAKKEDGGFIDSFPDLNLANYEDGGMMEEYKDGGMIKRADGSYSKRGLWDNIRDNIGSGKKPTKEMLEQERKIKAQEYRDGGYVVTRSNERKGKTHKVTGPDGTVKFFGDPDLKNNPSEKAKDAFYARHKKNLEGNPHFRAYARATWRDGGMIPEYADGGYLNQGGEGPGDPNEFTKAVYDVFQKMREVKTGKRKDYRIPDRNKDFKRNEYLQDMQRVVDLYYSLPPDLQEEYKSTASFFEKAGGYGKKPDGTIGDLINFENQKAGEVNPALNKALEYEGLMKKKHFQGFPEVAPQLFSGFDQFNGINIDRFFQDFETAKDGPMSIADKPFEYNPVDFYKKERPTETEPWHSKLNFENSPFSEHTRELKEDIDKAQNNFNELMIYAPHPKRQNDVALALTGLEMTMGEEGVKRMFEGIDLYKIKYGEKKEREAEMEKFQQRLKEKENNVAQYVYDYQKELGRTDETRALEKEAWDAYKSGDANAFYPALEKLKQAGRSLNADWKPYVEKFEQELKKSPTPKQIATDFVPVSPVGTEPAIGNQPIPVPNAPVQQPVPPAMEQPVANQNVYKGLKEQQALPFNRQLDIPLPNRPETFPNNLPLPGNISTPSTVDNLSLPTPQVPQMPQAPMVNQTTPYQPSATPQFQDIVDVGQMMNLNKTPVSYKQPIQPKIEMQQRTPVTMNRVTLPQQQYNVPNVTPQGSIPNLTDIANVGNLFNMPTTNAPNYTPLNQQFPAETPATNPSQQMLGNVIGGAAKVAQQYSESEERPGGPLPQYSPSQWPYGSNTPQDYTRQEPLNFNPSMEGRTAIPFDPTSLNRPLPSEQQMVPLDLSNLRQNELPSPTTPEEDPFKLRPLEYATIGLKGAALGKSIYDALQPAEKEQLRLNREAGLVNNMMAGRNVNMAAALNEALYNRNAALASNQARSANVQRALDMQTYANTERNAIRAKLEEQNMNNQLRMQEAQTRAQLGAAEAAERIRRQNVQSMNEATRRDFGRQVFTDLSNIGSELNKEQMYRDMYKNKREIVERQYNEYMNFLQQSGGRFTVANLPFTDYLQGKIPQIVVNTNYQQPVPEEPKKG